MGRRLRGQGLERDDIRARTHQRVAGSGLMRV
jgi:hypothetical protein